LQHNIILNIDRRSKRRRKKISLVKFKFI
jgi:hypothetical protein